MTNKNFGILLTYDGGLFHVILLPLLVTKRHSLKLVTNKYLHKDGWLVGWLDVCDAVFNIISVISCRPVHL